MSLPQVLESLVSVRKFHSLNVLNQELYMNLGLNQCTLHCYSDSDCEYHVLLVWLSKYPDIKQNFKF